MNANLFRIGFYYDLFPGLFQLLPQADRKTDSILQLQKELKPLKQLSEPRATENTAHFDELHYQPAQICPTFKKK